MPKFRTTAPSMSNSEIANVRIMDGDGALLADVAADATKNALFVQSESMASAAGVTAAGAVVAAAVAAEQAAITAAMAAGTSVVQIKDAAAHALNILSTGEADVNVNRLNGAAINIGAGAVGTGTQRVTLASDDPLVATTGVVGAAVTKAVQVGVKAQTTFPSAAVDNGDMVDPLHDEYGRQWLKGYDPGSNSLMFTDVAPIQSSVTEITFTQLTAAGSTTAVNIQEKNSYTFQVVVAAINTSVTVRVEGSLDNTSWFNMADDATDTTYAANGTYQLSKSGVKVKYVRFTFVSEVGGTAATIDVKGIFGR